MNMNFPSIRISVLSSTPFGVAHPFLRVVWDFVPVGFFPSVAYDSKRADNPVLDRI